MESINPDSIQPEPSENAISVFGNAKDVNDFPVLKAFQQYIDAEQAKARKRMLGLSVFFVILLSLVVITFTILMMNVSRRNQDLSDRLLDIALRERSAQPVVNVQPQAPVVQQPSPDAYMKPFLEKLESLTKAVEAQKQQPQAPAPIVVAPQVAPQQPVESAETKQLKAQLQNLQKQINEEKAKREAEKKEAERQRKVEEHRRRLYPEYYERLEQKPRSGVTAPTPEFVRPITSIPAVKTPPQPEKQNYVRPITTLPAAKPPAAVENQGNFVRPITTLPAAAAKPVASVSKEEKPVKKSLLVDVDKELQSLVQNAKPKAESKKDSAVKTKTPEQPAIKPQTEKSETLNVGDGVEMILPM